MNEDLGDYASTYAGMGLETFPCDPITKSPRVSQYLATTDVDQVREWWEKWPDSLIGHRVGPSTLILDVDPRHNGHMTWKALDKRFGLGEPARMHYSGRDDGGVHLWYERPDERLTTRELDRWAKEHSVGMDIKGRWTSGIDIIQRDHRYTILPPSPHPVTGKAYFWAQGKSFTAAPGPTPGPLVPFITLPPQEPAEQFHRVEADSIVDWFNEHHSLSALLGAEGWECVSGTGDDDGSEWRHPEATSAVSATVKDGSLYVYSTSTVFEPTEPGAPVGYSPFRVWATLKHGGDMSRAASEARKLKGPTSTPADAEEGTDGHAERHTSVFVDWGEFWTKEREEDEWLHPEVLAKGRGHAIYAWHGTGKSLFVLWAAAHVATTRDDVDVIYLDYEMTEGDLYERLSDMGYDEHSDLSGLHYALLPTLPPLDTEAGRDDLLELVGRMEREHVLVVIDTTSRATEGDENSNDTVRNFYRHTGIALKAAGCTWVRVDHAGKDKEKGQRGGSSKGDDVDVVWKLEAGEGRTVTLKREKARMGWVKDKVDFEQLEEPLRYKSAPVTYTAEAIRIARELDRLQIPTDMSARKAMGQAREAGVGGRDKYFNEATRLRRDPSRWPPKGDRSEPLETPAAVQAAVICPDPAAGSAAGVEDDL